jgi:hypothetical protein
VSISFQMASTPPLWLNWHSIRGGKTRLPPITIYSVLPLLKHQVEDWKLHSRRWSSPKWHYFTYLNGSLKWHVLTFNFVNINPFQVENLQVPGFFKQSSWINGGMRWVEVRENCTVRSFITCTLQV